MLTDTTDMYLESYKTFASNQNVRIRLNACFSLMKSRNVHFCSLMYKNVHFNFCATFTTLYCRNIGAVALINCLAVLFNMPGFIKAFFGNDQSNNVVVTITYAA